MNKTSIDRLGPFDKTEKCLNVIVETPKGSRVKYAYDLQSDFFLLSKVLPKGMVFPFNFGFVPKTLAADGDPLDVLILNEETLISGCLLKVRPLAVMKVTQTKHGKSVRNDRIIGHAIGKEAPPGRPPVKPDGKTVAQIEFFFAAYNEFYDKKFKVIGTGGPRKAMKIILQAMEMRHKNGKQ